MMFDRKLLELSCKASLVDTIYNSRYINEHTTPDTRYDMIEWVKGLSYEETVGIIHEYGVRDFEAKFKKFLKYGLAGIAGGIVVSGGVAATLVGGPALGAVAMYMFRKATDPCEQKCFRGVKGVDKKICKLQCQARAIAIILKDIKAERGKCDKTEKPEKCHRGLNLLRMKWEKKYQKTITELEAAVDKRKMKMRTEGVTRKPVPHPVASKVLKVGLAAGSISGVTPGAGAIVKALKYLKTMYEYKCELNCQRDENQTNKRLCYRTCAYEAISNNVKYIEKEMGKCNSTEDPYKCRKRLYKHLKRWRMKEVEAKTRLQNVKR